MAESQVTSASDRQLDFDDDTLKGRYQLRTEHVTEFYNTTLHLCNYLSGMVIANLLHSSRLVKRFADKQISLEDRR